MKFPREKKSRKKIQKNQIRYCLGKGPKEKKIVKEQSKRGLKSFKKRDI